MAKKRNKTRQAAITVAIKQHNAPRIALLPLGAMLTRMMLAPVFAFAADDNVPAAITGSEQTLPTVNVKDKQDEGNGYQGGTTRVAKTRQLPKDIPQAITIVSRQLMKDTNANTLKDALRSVSGLTFNAAEGGRIGDNFTLRGFFTYGDLYMDGIRDTAQINRETFNLEQVDVLRGSAAMIFGRGQAGGVINQVSKQAELDDKGSLSTTIGNFDYKRVTADLNKMINDETAIRFNAMKTDAGSSRNAVESKRDGFAPTIGFGIGTANEFSLSYYYLKVDNVPDFGIRFFDKRPLNIPADRFFGTTQDYEINEQKLATGTYKHVFSPDSEIRTVVRQADYQRELWGVVPNLVAGTPTDATVVNRQRQARGGNEHTLTSQTDFTTRFNTGAFKHELLAGLELLNERAARCNYGAPGFAVSAPATTLGNPDPNDPVPALYGNRVCDPASVNSYTGKTTAFYGQDMIEFIPHWKVMLGMRRDDLSANYSNGASVDYGENSYRAGLSFQPNDITHYYVAANNSFSPTADLYQFTPASVKYDPEYSRNYEIGAKWELFDGNLSLRTALYRAIKYWERNQDVESAQTAALLSKKRHTNGFEIEAAGRITKRLEMFGGIAVMDAQYDEMAPGQNTAWVGQRPPNTPPYTANLWATYKLDGGWKVGGGVNSVGARRASRPGAGLPSINIAPGFSRYDGLVEYTRGNYDFRLNVMNILNTRNYEAVYDGGLVTPGTERAFQFTVAYKY